MSDLSDLKERLRADCRSKECTCPAARSLAAIESLEAAKEKAEQRVAELEMALRDVLGRAGHSQDCRDANGLRVDEWERADPATRGRCPAYCVPCICVIGPATALLYPATPQTGSTDEPA